MKKVCQASMKKVLTTGFMFGIILESVEKPEYIWRDSSVG